MNSTDHTFVHLYTNWDEKLRTGKATWQAPKGKLIKDVDFHASTWGASGYSTHLSRSDSLLDFIEKIKELAEESGLLAQTEGDSQKKEEHQKKERWLREYLLHVSSSNDTIVVDWRCQSSGNILNHSRGKVHVTASISLEDWQV